MKKNITSAASGRANTERRTDMKPKKVDTILPMEERIKKMAKRTLDAIGADLFMDDEMNPTRTMRRSELIEVIADADHMLSYGGDPEAYKAWLEMSHTKQNKLLREAFPEKSFCF